MVDSHAALDGPGNVTACLLSQGCTSSPAEMGKFTHCLQLVMLEDELDESIDILYSKENRMINAESFDDHTAQAWTGAHGHDVCQ